LKQPLPGDRIDSSTAEEVTAMTEEFVRATRDERRARVVKVGDVPLVNLAPGIDTAIVCGNNLTLSFATVAPGAAGAMHSHPNEQMIVVLEGTVDIVLEGKAYGLKAGEVMTVPSNLQHTGIGGEHGCRMLEVFTPARKDFEEKLAKALAELK
jgi:quercetin dioxygenase-like cupin family protein